MEETRQMFPALRNKTYLNTPVYGPLYDGLLEWRQEHDLDFLIRASEMRDTSLKIISETRTTVGRFFNCPRENVALINNFSTGLNMLLEGLDTRRKVVLIENDYPSVEWPFGRRGFPVTTVKMDARVEQRIYDAIKKENGSILALSIVQWQNGLKIDLDFLNQLKSQYPDLLIIADGTQFLGTTNFDFEASAIDVLGASAYKWLLAGYGNGFMLFKDMVKDQCVPKTIGFNAANARPEMRHEIRFAKRFEPGHLSCLSFGSLNHSLHFLMQLGKDAIAEHNRELTVRALAELNDLRLLSKWVTARKEHGTILNFKGDDRLFRKLKEQDIICAQRGGGIRIGLHFFNTQNDIDAIVRILKTSQ